MSSISAVFTKENMTIAWRKVKEKGKSGGIDNITIEEYEKNIEGNLNDLLKEVIESRYIPEPYKRFFIEKNTQSFGLRPLALLSVKDKIVQNCFLNYYRYKIEKSFVDTSYAYRIGKSHNKAINRVNDFISKHNRWIYTIDIDNFFDNIDRQILLQKCRILFNDVEIMKLLEMWIKTGVVQRGKYTDTGKGITQGGVISPFLSNLYLHSYDVEMKSKNFNNVRYADNIILLEKEKDRLHESLNFSRMYLKQNLKLDLNSFDEEAIDATTRNFTFCGIQFQNGKRKIDPGKFDGIKKTISLTFKNEKLENLVSKINKQTEGIKRYYSAFDTEDQITAIEEHLINELTDRIKSEFEKKNIRSIKDAKNITSKIIFLNSHTNFAKESLVQKILHNCEEKSKIGSKSDAEKAIGKKKKLFQKIWFENLDILVSGAYSQIGKSGYKITVRKQGSIRTEISAERIKNILIISKSVTISSDVVKLCAEKNIRINYFDELGKPYASIIPASAPINILFNKQSEALVSSKAPIIARNIVYAKIKNQQSIIKYFIKNKNYNSGGYIFKPS